MKIRVPLISLTLACLALAAVPALTQPPPGTAFYTNGPVLNPTNPASPGSGTPIGPSSAGPFAASLTFDCPFADCDVTGFTFDAWVRNISNSGIPVPTGVTSTNWQLTQLGKPFNFKSPYGSAMGAPVVMPGPCVVTVPGAISSLCSDLTVNFGKSIDVPHGISNLELWGATALDDPANTAVVWARGSGPSTGLILNLSTGAISPNTLPGSFTVYGTPTVPEPGSMVLLGTGVLGLAGILRRKLMR